MKKKYGLLLICSLLFTLLLSFGAGAWFTYNVEFSLDASVLTTHDGTQYHQTVLPDGVFSPVTHTRPTTFGHFFGETNDIIDVWTTSVDGIMTAIVDGENYVYVTDGKEDFVNEALGKMDAVFYWESFLPSLFGFSFEEINGDLPFGPGVTYASDETFPLSLIDTTTVWVGNVYAADENRLVAHEAGRIYQDDKSMFYIDYGELPEYVFHNGYPSFDRGETTIHRLTKEQTARVNEIIKASNGNGTSEDDPDDDVGLPPILFWIMAGFMLFVPPLALLIVSFLCLLAKRAKHKKGWATVLGMALVLLAINIVIFIILL